MIQKTISILTWCGLCTKKPVYKAQGKSNENSLNTSTLQVKRYNVQLEMFSKLMGNNCSRVVTRFETTGNVFRAKKSSRKATVFHAKKI